jgi:hypothetical protein
VKAMDKEFLPKTLALLKQWLEEDDKDENGR